MSSHCPECQNPIEADFGVVTCSKCFSILFVDMEGNVQLSEKSQSEPAVPFMEAIPEAPNGLEQNFNDSWMQEQEESRSPSEAIPIYQQEPDFQPEAEPYSEPAPELEQEPEVFHQAEIQSEPDPEFQLERHSVTEVAEFSNSDQVTGPLSYNILIEAIDTADIRRQLSEVFSDSKFQWDSKELLKSVKMGQLKLENINPVKASVLINRLQTIPVKVTWVQNVFS